MYSADETKRYLLEDASWRRDIIPEIMDGHNIVDFVDPDIEAKLEALELEEDERAAAFAASVGRLLCLCALPLEIMGMLRVPRPICVNVDNMEDIWDMW